MQAGVICTDAGCSRENECIGVERCEVQGSVGKLQQWSRRRQSLNYSREQRIEDSRDSPREKWEDLATDSMYRCDNW